MSSRLTLSVIVHVRDGATELKRALTAIRATNLCRDDYELIVVDDASTDGSAEIASRYADTVVRLTARRSGPAYARNRGAELAHGEVLAFVNYDSVLEPDTLPRLLAALSTNDVEAVSTSHAQLRVAPNLASEYWNLVVVFGEKTRLGNSGDLASPCAVIRRDAFFSAGMYDEWRFEQGSLEGIELGARLAAAGKKVLWKRDLAVDSLKQWNVRTLCREVWYRSTRLTRSLGYQSVRSAVPGDPVFTLSQSMAPVFVVLCAVASSAAFLPPVTMAAKTAVVFLGAILLNLRSHAFFVRSRGLFFATAVAPLHLLVQSVSAVGLCVGWLLREAIGDYEPDATTQAYAEVGVETWPPVPRASRS